MAEDKQDLYIGIKDPNEVRRNLLEGSRNILRLLQRIERFKSLKDEKEELFERLRTLTKEITDLDIRLKAMLPKQAIKRSSKIKATEQPKKDSKKAPPAKPKKKSEIDKLEDSLSDIEEKLKKLS